MMLKPYWLGLTALLAASISVPANADVKNWAAGDGNWAVGSNWSPAGAPTGSDSANIVFTDGVARTVTVDSAGAALAGAVDVDLTGDPQNAITLGITANSLSDDSAIIGDAGQGVVTQSGGVHFVRTFLTLGSNLNSTGTYTLSGGALNTNFTEFIGNAGAGTFTQTGGSHTVSTLNVGYGSTGLGSYSLSGSSSTLQVFYETISQSATGNGTQSGGRFTQSGGSHQVSQFYMAQDAGSSATYSLSGGTLAVNEGEVIGLNGTASFNQTAGVNNALELDLGVNASGQGTYTISGGSLSANHIGLGGTLSGFGGSGSLTISSGAIVNVSNTIDVFNSPGSQLVLQGGSLTTNAINVHSVPSLFTWNSGTLNFTNDLVLGSSTVSDPNSGLFGIGVSLTTGRTLNVVGNETIGGGGLFKLTMSGGTNNVTGDIMLKTGGSLAATTTGALNYTNLNQMGGQVTGVFVNNTNFVYQGGSILAQFTNNGTATFAANAAISGTVQNNGTMTVNSGQSYSAIGTGTTNFGSFILAGGSILAPGSFANAVGGVFTGHGTILGTFANHGTFILDGPLTLSNAFLTNDGTVQGAGTITNSGASFSNTAGGIINATTPGGALVFTSGINNVAGAIMNIGPTSTLSISSLTSGWSNSGLINLQGSGAKLAGTTLTNSGTIQGFGTVTNSLSSSGNGGILRAIGGELDFTATGISNPTSGQIQALAGSSIVFLQGMGTNSGMISLTGGTFDNFGHILTNSGTINGYGTIRTAGLTNSTNKLLSVGEGNMDVFGNFTNNGIVNIQTGRSAYFYGTVNGNGSFTGGGTAVFLNSLSPGNSPASVKIAGGATLVGGTSLNMELGSTSPGRGYDQLQVGGALSIGGILTVSLLDGFSPAVGNSFDLLDWGTLSGTFSSLSLPTLPGRQWDTSQLYTTGVLGVILSPLAGDYNGNGVVDAADYVTWQSGLGTTYTQGDYDVWKSTFGNSASGGSQLAGGQSAVPEPAAGLMAYCGCCICALAKRLRRRL